MDENQIYDLVGAAYEVGHAHGMNAFRTFQGKEPQRIDEGWGQYAEHINRAFEQLRAENERLKESQLTYKEADRALEIFRKEYVGQDSARLWRYCIEQAKLNTQEAE